MDYYDYWKKEMDLDKKYKLKGFTFSTDQFIHHKRFWSGQLIESLQSLVFVFVNSVQATKTHCNPIQFNAVRCNA